MYKKLIALCAVIALVAGCGSDAPLSSQGDGKIGGAAKLVVSAGTAGGSPYSPASSGNLEPVAQSGLTTTSEAVGGKPDRVARFSLAPVVGRADGTLSISGSVIAVAEGTTIDQLVWDWGDGSTSTGFPPVEHVYEKGGDHRFSVTATNNLGESQGINLTGHVPDAVVSTSADIAVLSGFTLIAGSLLIEDTNLFSLAGLGQIATVGGNVTIQRNASLNSIAGLSGLTTIDGTLFIGVNGLLTSLTGLENLLSIGAGAIPGVGLYLQGSSIVDLVPLASIQHIESLIIRDNASLTSLSALSGLTGLEGRLVIERNALLTNLNGLEGISIVGNNTSYPECNGNLDLNANPVLTDLSGLSGITSIRGFLGIRENAALTSLSGLNNVQSVGAPLHLSANPALTSLDGLSGVQTIGRDLGIWNNGSLNNLDMPSLASIGGDFSISGNAAAGVNMPLLTSIGASLWLNGSNLQNLDGLSALTTIGYELGIWSSALTSLNLTALTSIGHDFALSTNESLVSVSLPALVSVGSGGLEFYNLDAMTQFSLPALTTVAGSFQFNDHAVLSSFDLSALASVGAGGCLCENPQLANASVQALVDQLVAAGFSGSFTVSGNLP